MRVSQGVPCGRKVHLYHPELLDEYEEVIIYTREEFERTFGLIKEQIDFINKVDFRLDRDKEWDLKGYWPGIMERIHIMGLGMSSFLGDKPLQTYLDTYLYNESKVPDDVVEESVVSASEKPWGVNWL